MRKAGTPHSTCCECMNKLRRNIGAIYRDEVKGLVQARHITACHGNGPFRNWRIE